MQNTVPKQQNIYTFSSAHGTFSNVDHLVATNQFLKDYKKIDMIQSTLSDHKGKLKINNRIKTEKSTNLWKLKNTVLTSRLNKKS